jgi:pimeloyl-ACP methyl ester carboxylesterase
MYQLMVKIREIIAPDGRALRVYDTGDAGRTGDAVVIWHHGTPQTGEPPEPLRPALAQRELRCVAYDRPGYGGSAPHVGRDVAAAAADVAAITDALDIGEFATIGISSGAPHALACAALLPGRVTRAVAVAGPAPFRADGLDWFAGMAAGAAARMRAGARGRQAIETHLNLSGFAGDVLPLADLTALVDDWQWLAAVSQQAMAGGFRGAVDDVLCMVEPWGFPLAKISAPVLLVHGLSDGIVPSAHSEWLARQLNSAELWLRPAAGHIAVLNSCAAALDWLTAVREPGGSPG